jgi:hypothetical protein
MAAAPISLVLTPHGHVVLVPSADAPTLPEELQRRLERTFERGAAHGLLIWGCVRLASAAAGVRVLAGPARYV